jgi:glycosyltransferase involved in cell wall biosynthesis
VPALCSTLLALGDDIYLHSLGAAPSSTKSGFHNCIYPRRQFPYSLGVSPAMKLGLRRAAVSASVIHTHGLWMMPNLYPAKVADPRRTPLVLSPRGMMDRWAWRHHRWRKRVMWWVGQAGAVRAAACFHATAPCEAECVRDLGIRAPIAVIPNGVDIPDPALAPEHPSTARTLLFLARVHEKKGVDILVRSWRNVQDRFPDWRVLIVGPDNGGYSLQMRDLAARIGVRRLHFKGKIPQAAKSACFASSELYVLPTHAENWGVSIAEALAHGVPAIVGRGAPWSGLEKRGCGWWIDNSVDALTATLETALALSPRELSARGALGRQWVEEEFTWRSVAQTMRQVYLWLLDRGPKPPCVET